MIRVDVVSKARRRRTRWRSWKAGDTRAVLETIARLQIEQIEGGRNAAGKPLGRYKSGRRQGQVITLRRTGRTLASVIARRRSTYSGSAGPKTDAARWIQRRFGAFGLDDKNTGAVNKMAAELFEQNYRELSP